jgi:hypothetical protein
MRLNNKASRLDILDHSQLTSFPLAPPPPKKSDDYISRSPEINAIEPSDSRPTSSYFELDPIVLVEDYIKRQRIARKKLSVFDLKNSMKNLDVNIADDGEQGNGEINYISRCRTILSNTPPNPRTSSDCTDETKVPDQYLLTENTVHRYDHEDVFESLLTPRTSSTECFTIPTSQVSFISQSSLHTLKTSSHEPISGAATLKLSEHSVQAIPEFSLNDTRQSLKYCIICETPLYDLSSHLSPNDKYVEFVCSECTEKYEALSKLVDDFDEQMSGCRTLPRNIENIEEALSRPLMKRKHNAVDFGFSMDLITKLQRHLEDKDSRFSSGFGTSKEQIWLMEAKRKLRWRWRINGLLPRFLNGR